MHRGASVLGWAHLLAAVDARNGCVHTFGSVAALQARPAGPAERSARASSVAPERGSRRDSRPSFRRFPGSHADLEVGGPCPVRHLVCAAPARRWFSKGLVLSCLGRASCLRFGRPECDVTGEVESGYAWRMIRTNETRRSTAVSWLLSWQGRSCSSACPRWRNAGACRPRKVPKPVRLAVAR